jgi:hypothetical protein
MWTRKLLMWSSALLCVRKGRGNVYLCNDDTRAMAMAMAKDETSEVFQWRLVFRNGVSD